MECAGGVTLLSISVPVSVFISRLCLSVRPSSSPASVRLQDPVFRSRVAKRWLSLRAGPLSDGEVSALIVKTTAKITPAAVRNYK